MLHCWAWSTKAESRWFRQMGWHVVNMTGYPESVLAAELGIRYASIALVTDFDAGIDGVPAVTMDEVFAVMRANVAKVREVITAAIGAAIGSAIDAPVSRPTP